MTGHLVPRLPSAEKASVQYDLKTALVRSGHTHSIRITRSEAKKELGYKCSLKVI